MIPTFILVTLTVLTLAARYLKQAQPLFNLLPAKWRWVPSATLSAIAAFQVVAPTNAETYVGAVLSGVIAFALAAQAGVHDVG